jgi:hypothetical protein
MTIALLAGLVLAAAPPAAAHVQPQVTECILLLEGWGGGQKANREIKTVPVPDGFKRMWFEQPCNSLDRSSLLEWHLRVGTVSSTAAALSWVEANSLTGVEAPNVFLANAERDVAAAQRRVAGATVRASSHADAFVAYAFVADQYLRGAEYFHSPELLAKAKPYVDAENLGFAIFLPDASVSLERGNPASSWIANFDSRQVNERRELSVRYAVERAYQTGGKDDIAAAEKLLDQTPGGPEMMGVAADDIERTHGDGCAKDAAPEIATALAKACATESDFQGRLARFWRDRAVLDQVVARDGIPESEKLGTTSLKYASDLLYPMEQFGCCWSVRAQRYTREVDEIVGLYLADADAGVTCLANGLDDHAARCPDFRDALESAEAIVSPAGNPNRFRQIAAIYLRRCLALSAIRHLTCDKTWYLGREAVVVRIVASHLDDLDEVDPRTSSGDAGKPAQ